MNNENNSSKEKTYLILGCGGYLGSHLLDRLLIDGSCNIIGWDLDKARITEHLDSDNFVFHECDINSETAYNILESEVQNSDVVIHLAAIANPSEYNKKPVDVIYANFINTYRVVELCARYNKWLVFFSSSEVYGRTLSSYNENGKYTNEKLYILNEDKTPLIMGPISNQRWSYACAKQLMERFIVAHNKEYGMPYTIVRPLNAFGPRMDYIPGIDGEGIPRVLACFMSALMNREPLLLVDDGIARRTIVSIYDMIDAVELILEKPDQSMNEIFNIGNDNNEVTIRELAEIMRELYAEVSGDKSYRNHPIKSISSKEFYGEGYEDCDRRMPSLDKARNKLGWNPGIPLNELLKETVTYYYNEYIDSIMNKKSTN